MSTDDRIWAAITVGQGKLSTPKQVSKAGKPATAAQFPKDQID